MRAVSQLDLSLEAGVSPRHLSFIETGRSVPSRQMLVALSDRLDIPLRERNRLLGAAGYAAIYPETPMDAPPMAQVRRAIDGILKAHTISPAFVLNRNYDIVQWNDAAAILTGGAPAAVRVGPAQPNLLRLLLSPDGLRPIIENWEELSAIMIRRVQREAMASDRVGADLQRILDECVPGAGSSSLRRTDWTQPPDVVIPMRIRAGATRLSFFSTITTLGTPCDVTLEELRIEALHAADKATEDYLVSRGRQADVI